MAVSAATVKGRPWKPKPSVVTIFVKSRLL